MVMQNQHAVLQRVLQCVAVCGNALQHIAVCCSELQCTAVCCSVLQCVAVCCSVLQCVAVCCSVLQCKLTSKLHVFANLILGGKSGVSSAVCFPNSALDAYSVASKVFCRYIG